MSHITTNLWACIPPSWNTPTAGLWSSTRMAEVGKVSVLYGGNALLGEGPFYDQAREELVWVDFTNKLINFLDVNTRSNRSLQLEGRPASAAIPCQDDDSKLVAMIGRTICLVDRGSGTVQPLAPVGDDKPNNRFNDAKCDRLGRLWCGTLCENQDTSKQQLGCLYSFDGETVKEHLSDIALSNGIAWSPDWTKMYYVDSGIKKVYSFDYNESACTITNQAVAVDYNQDPALGIPDGISIDAEGKLWVAGFLGGAVTRWDPATGKKLAYIPIPAKCTTSCCFGGPNYDKLFVTSAALDAKESDLQQYPHAGAVFVVEELGVCGLPPQKYKGTKVKL